MSVLGGVQTFGCVTNIYVRHNEREVNAKTWKDFCVDE